MDGIISVFSGEYKYELLKVEFVSSEEDSGVLKVGLNRPNKRNAFNMRLFNEYCDCFKKIKVDSRVRCVVVYGIGSMFCSGIDFKEIFQPQEFPDSARYSLGLNNLISRMQESLSEVEKCNKPVIMASHNLCIGLGLEIILAGDIRMCTEDCKFSLKEVDLGLAADVGALQRLPRAVGNLSWAREICMTARTFDSIEAMKFGLVSQVFPNFDSLLDGAIKLAQVIASKSPVAIYGTKHLLNYSRDHSVSDGLMYTSAWNSVMLQSEDLQNAVMGQMTKTTPKFSKL